MGHDRALSTSKILSISFYMQQKPHEAKIIDAEDGEEPTTNNDFMIRYQVPNNKNIKCMMQHL